MRGVPVMVSLLPKLVLVHASRCHCHRLVRNQKLQVRIQVVAEGLNG